MAKHGRFSRVAITAHAIERWQQYGGRGRLTGGKVRHRLLGMIRGRTPIIAGAVYVPLDGGLVAVCVPETWGGWSVVTILPPQGWEGERHAG